MFPSFTGSARPKRQVNLSGRNNNNPFAAQAGSRASSAPQTAQNALAQAQQERVLRQQERERPPAATKIQKTWRGHRARSDTATECRRRWDTEEQKDQASGAADRYLSEDECLSQLQLLNRFIALSGGDVRRLHHFAQKYMTTIRVRHVWGPQWTYPRVALAKNVMITLESSTRRPKSGSKISEKGYLLPSNIAFDLLILLESLARDVAQALVSTF